MNSHRLGLSLAIASVIVASQAMAAEKFGPLELAGFLKDEYSSCDNCSPGLVNPSSYDPRGVLNPPYPQVNQASAFNGHAGSNLGLIQQSAALQHEFDNAMQIEGRVTGRMRNGTQDIPGRYLIDTYLGVTHPKWGSVKAGTITARSWSRSDAFAYPLGLSNAWALSGAGYGVFPKAIRYTTRMFETRYGKLSLEATYALSGKQDPINNEFLKKTYAEQGTSIADPAPRPRLLELFAQFSNDKNLVELVVQTSEGGLQSSFSQGSFVGSQGNTESLANAAINTPGYQTPHENVETLQGNYYYSPQWRLSYGIRRNEWSGQQQQCDFGFFNPAPAAPALPYGCFYDQAGFNYASDKGLHHAIEYDGMAGIAYLRGIWAFTAGGVQMNKAYTHSPTEWGQGNRATFVNLGVYRRVPEVSQYLEVYGGLAREMFWRAGPAPLSMPGNLAFGGADPRVSRYSNTFTIGGNIVF